MLSLVQSYLYCVITLFYACTLSSTATASQKTTDETQTDVGWEYTYETSVASAYVWRGLNLLGEGNQHYSPGVYFPSFSTTYGIWTLGWSAALQMSGANFGRNVTAAAGMEQDGYVQVEKEWKYNLSWTAVTSIYGFPASRKEIAGANHAAYIEPGLGVSGAWKINWSLKVFWFHGLQIHSEDYAYVYACTSKEWDSTLRWMFKLQLEGGHKWYFNDTNSDNVWDVQLLASVKRIFSNHVACGLQAAVTWSNFAGKSFVQETVLWTMTTLSLSW